MRHGQVNVSLPQFRRPTLERRRAVCPAHVQRRAVILGENRVRLDVELVARARHPDRDLAAVRNQNFEAAAGRRRHREPGIGSSRPTQVR